MRSDYGSRERIDTGALRRVVELGGTTDMPANQTGHVVMVIFRDPAREPRRLIRAAPA